MSAFDIKDGGWRSRKLLLGTATILLTFSAWCLTAFFPALAPEFSTFVGGVVGVYGLFVGANIGNKFVVGANVSKMQKPPA